MILHLLFFFSGVGVLAFLYLLACVALNTFRKTPRKQMQCDPQPGKATLAQSELSDDWFNPDINRPYP